MNEHLDDTYERDWLRSLTILHRGHWEAARFFDGMNLLLGLGSAVIAGASGTAALTQLTNLAEQQRGVVWVQVMAGLLGLIAAAVISIQTFFRSSELAARHKQAAIKFGQLRRDLEEDLSLGLPPERDRREKLLSSLRQRWATADDESPPLPKRFYRKAAATVEVGATATEST